MCGIRIMIGCSIFNHPGANHDPHQIKSYRDYDNYEKIKCSHIKCRYYISQINNTNQCPPRHHYREEANTVAYSIYSIGALIAPKLEG